MNQLSSLRKKIRQHTLADEDQCVKALLADHPLDSVQRRQIISHAQSLVEAARKNEGAQGTLDAFLHEFGLSNKEGIALMCLAEALLRIPDADTADKLIAEKVHSGDWQKHIGQSNSIFVNASTWGLMLTGKLIKFEDLNSSDFRWYETMVSRVGEPLIRQAMLQAMRILGGQYVLGRTINEAINRGRKENHSDVRFSFDMLGEGARTERDANRYFDAYKKAIEQIGETQTTDNPKQSDGISIKLSALHPRYEYRQQARVKKELLPRLESLALLAKKYNIGLNIDAEEADRLDLSLDLFEAIASNTQLENWQGLGFVLQAYQKRAPYVARWLAELAQTHKRQFSVRLVKGAYWDSEIKHAQEEGHEDYPVFTRKINTDLSYQTCAAILFDASTWIYPQFATHNAHTISMILAMGHGKDYEFQRLHGMGHLLYEQLIDDTNARPLRIYAPVGAHKDLLPYLVRRLLENGANSSFVNRFLDKATPVETLIQDITEQVESTKPHRHPQIPKPRMLFRCADVSRINASGYDLNNPLFSEAFCRQIQAFGQHQYNGGSIINGNKSKGVNPVYSPVNSQVIGLTKPPSHQDIELALHVAHTAYFSWNKHGGNHRAELLENVANALESQRDELIALISYETGRTIKDALDELREAVDFARYYAALAKKQFATPTELESPTGESNHLTLEGRGVFLCISPWNFPLAIFVGQIAAALAAGNTVIAKPAEQSPLVASKAVNLMHESGIPCEVLHLAIGDRQLGASLVADERIAGVAFTGSTTSAKSIQRSLAERNGRIVPLIAETGGQNAMIVDSSALPEQVVDDVIASAFKSAGQRCSALRILFLQEDIADNMLTMLSGACAQLTLGDPWLLSSDIGPVIDRAARQTLLNHVERMKNEAKTVYAHAEQSLPSHGLFVGPHIFEIKSLAQLKEEVFGPILHVIRFSANKLDRVIDSINQSGFGLTLGIHTRIESQARYIYEHTHVGNTYVNRNMIGAVVGVNPFGGQGLSGTGPKAGGPHYLLRFASEKTLTINHVATGGNAALLSLDD